jgi:cytochrome c
LSVPAIVTLCLATGSAIAQETAVEAGAFVYRRCLPCHQVGEGAANTMGPVLNDVLGRQAGTYPNFTYSQAITDAGQNGLIWTTETLSQFIASPKKVLPGNKMAFIGVRDDEDRSNIVAYLRSLSPGYVPPAK